MRTALSRTLATLLAAFLIQPLLVGSSSAATAVGQFNVKLTIASNCTVTPPADLNFGTITDTSTTGASASAFSGIGVDVTVRCSNQTAYSVGLSNGESTGATMNTRKMQRWINSAYGGQGAGAADTVGYNLYKGACASNGGVWGSSGTDLLGSQTGTGANQNHAICGKLNAMTGAMPSAGDYQDRVQVTVTY